MLNKMVRRKGLEPSRAYCSQESESCASANSATLAREFYYTILSKKNEVFFTEKATFFLHICCLCKTA